ncbi:MAG: LytR/AlgR family response regulator transcription factor [Bacteroidota bacterium]
MIKTIIIDDEPRSCKVLYKILTDYCQDVEVKTFANNINEGIEAIKFYKPDIVFLDIEMPGGDGFSLLQHFEKPSFCTIMITAYNQFAIQAIKASVFDYVLKPIGIEQIKHTIERYRRREKPPTPKVDAITKLPDKIAIPSQKGYELIDTNNIIWAQASNTYTVFHLTGGASFVSSSNLKKFEEQLETTGKFLRIHHSYTINLGHVQRIIKTKYTTVVMSDGKELEVSVRRKEELVKVISNM